MAARLPLFRASLLALLLGLLSILAVGAADVLAVEIYPLDMLEPGQRGEALSVFDGRGILRFEVEILDRVDGQAPYPLVLVRCLGEELTRSGVSQGMSGSPVYVDGLWLGAIAFNFSYAKEPLALVTPAAAMLALAERPGGSPAGATAPGDLGELPFLAPDWQATAVEALDLSAPLALSVGGLAPARFAALETVFRPAGLELMPMGRDSGGEDGREATEPAPGAAVAVELLRGPISAAAIGTISHRDGDRIWAFGHPFLGEGPLALPIASARIHAVVPSLLNSFKLGSVGAPLGTWLQDGESGIYGRLGASPALLPLRVSLRADGEAPLQAEFEIARHRRLLPSLLRMALTGWLPGRIGGAQIGALDLTLRLHPSDAEAVTVRQRFAGPGSASVPGAWLGSLMTALQDGPAGPLPLDSLVVALDWRRDQRPLRLETLSLAVETVTAGEDWHLQLRLLAADGNSRERELRFPSQGKSGLAGLAAGARLAAGRYKLHVADGATFDGWNAKRLPALYRFTDHPELLALLGRLGHSGELVMWLETPGQGGVVGGRELTLPTWYRELSPSLRSAGGALPKKPRRLVASRREVAASASFNGHLSIPVTVRAPHARSSQTRSEP